MISKSDQVTSNIHVNADKIQVTRAINLNSHIEVESSSDHEVQLKTIEDVSKVTGSNPQNTKGRSNVLQAIDL